MTTQHRPRDEHGAVATEFLLVISMLIVVFLLMLQYAAKAHAERVATAAAHEGLAVASGYGGTAANGQRVARQSLAAIGPGLRGADIVASRGAVNASVTITGRVDQLVPFLAPTVRVHVEGPVERFVDGPTEPAP